MLYTDHRGQHHSTRLIDCGTNCRSDLAARLGELSVKHGFALTSVSVDARTGSQRTAQALDKAGIVANYNAIPFDPRKPFDPSGIRLGTPAVTSRGMGVAEMERIAAWMDDVAEAHANEARLAQIAGEVKELCSRFPAPGIRV